jgi:hypothetical protein
LLWHGSQQSHDEQAREQSLNFAEHLRIPEKTSVVPIWNLTREAIAVPCYPYCQKQAGIDAQNQVNS